jgi:hypothetical protein
VKKCEFGSTVYEKPFTRIIKFHTISVGFRISKPFFSVDLKKAIDVIGLSECFGIIVIASLFLRNFLMYNLNKICLQGIICTGLNNLISKKIQRVLTI